MSACGEGEPSSVNSKTWLTEGEYRFSGDPEHDVLFSRVPVLRADPYRDRLFVLDSQDAELSVWTPEGSLAFVLGGPGEGPGEFTFPTRVEIVDSGGFYVREGWGSRFTFYQANGTLKGTDVGATATLRYRDYGVTLEAPTGDDGYFAVPLIGSSSFVDRKIDRYPLLRVRRSHNGDLRAPEPIFWLSSRNKQHPIKLMDGRTAWVGQIFGDSDLTWFEPGSAGAICGPRKEGRPEGFGLMDLPLPR